MSPGGQEKGIRITNCPAKSGGSAVAVVLLLFDVSG
jgi:hypothetical protein